MQSIIYRIGNAITSISAVILVLMLTIVAMIFFSHTVFYETLPDTMVPWERQVAAWVISCSWELTILVVVCNVELLVSKRIPIVLSVCSGFVILFFIHAFDTDLSVKDYLQRWFIGCLVASINIVFSSLFYRKWCESNTNKSLSQQIIDQNINLSERNSELRYSKAKLNELDTKLLESTDYIIELEAFKENELRKRTCDNCGETFSSVNRLTSHRPKCGQVPEHKAKMSIYDK
jgi:hypothetical protein